MPSLRSKRIRLLPLAAISILTILTLGACSKHDERLHPGQPVEKRQAIFKHILRTFEPMGMVMRGRAEYEKGDFLRHAQELQALIKQPWVYFTADSNYGKSRARPEVWEKSAEFKQGQEKLALSVDQLVQSAQTGSLEAIRPAFKETEKTCQSCHDEFRHR
jgi:cytochrome c556